MGKLKWAAYIFLGAIMAITVYSIYEGAVTDTTGFGGLGYAIAAAWLGIFIAIGNGIAGIITHYLNPLNW